MNIARYMMFFVFGMLLGLLLSALLPSLALWLLAELLISYQVFLLMTSMG
jgi:hypothetical protein